MSSDSKEVPTVSRREFSRNVGKYLGGRYDIVGRGGLDGRLYPSDYDDCDKELNFC